MRWLLLVVLVTGLKSNAQERFQLAPPYLKFKSVFFEKTQEVQIKFEQHGTQIRYTLDGTEPNEKSNLYTQPVIITKHNQQIKAKVFSANFRPSETVSAIFVRQGLAIASCSSNASSAQYPGSSNRILFDNKGGSNSFNDGSWMGFDCDTVSVSVQLATRQTISSLLTELMDGQGSWIFLPQQVKIYSKENGVLKPVELDKEYVSDTTDHKITGPQLLNFRFRNPIETQQILLEMEVVRKMPGWHSAPGSHAWLFIDEIKVY